MVLKQITFLLMLVMLTLGITTPASALPVRPVVTVVNNNGDILLQEAIQYTGAYKSPLIKTFTNVVTQTPTVQPRPVPISRSNVGDARLVVKTAYEQLGKRYAGGGNGPHSFDCSGLARYSYQKIGINLPRTAASQFQTGIRVGRGELTPGDLVFFGSNGSAGINHVGIYVGDNNFIHAATSRRGVIQSSLNESYYVKNYKGAVRLVR